LLTPLLLLRLLLPLLLPLRLSLLLLGLLLLLRLLPPGLLLWLLLLLPLRLLLPLWLLLLLSLLWLFLSLRLLLLPLLLLRAALLLAASFLFGRLSVGTLRPSFPLVLLGRCGIDHPKQQKQRRGTRCTNESLHEMGSTFLLSWTTVSAAGTTGTAMRSVVSRGALSVGLSAEP